MMTGQSAKDTSTTKDGRIINFNVDLTYIGNSTNEKYGIHFFKTSTNLFAII